MKWQKRGMIFHVSDHTLSAGCEAFAKSPQAIVWNDFIRIYFTSQRRTENGKWMSCPQFVDMSKDFKTILRVSDKPLMSEAQLGAFDEHGIFPLHVFRDHNKVKAYTCGWSRRISVSVDMAIGLAHSDDNGETFERFGSGGPIMTANITESCMVGDPFVIKDKDHYRMWYIYGSTWRYYEVSDSPDRMYKIAQATSSDGVHWIRDGEAIIPDVMNDECQALPTVIKIGGIYHMYFCYRKAYDFRNNPENAYRLGYATSMNGVDWVRNDNQGGLYRSDTPDWDSDMMCYPHIFACDDHIYMLYNGNEFGRHGFGLAELMTDKE